MCGSECTTAQTEPTRAPERTGNEGETLSVERLPGEWVILEERECPRGRVERRGSWPFVAAALDRLQHDVSAAVAFGVLRPLVPDGGDLRRLEATSVVLCPRLDP